MQTLINGFKTNRAFAVTSFFVLLLIAVALAAPLIAPYDPLEATMRRTLTLRPMPTTGLARISWGAIISAVFCTVRRIP